MSASRLLGIAGFIGAIGTGLGEYMLHYSAFGYSNAAEYGYFKTITEYRATTGHFTAILCLPLYFCGYLYLYKILESGNRALRIAFLVTGIYGITIGGFWLGGRAYLHAAVTSSLAQTGNAELSSLIARIAFLNETLIQIARIIILASSICLAWIILGGKTFIPKWVAALNPITLVLVAFALFLWVPVLGNHIMPVAMNFAHIVLFGVMLIVQSRQRALLGRLAAEIR